LTIFRDNSLEILHKKMGVVCKYFLQIFDICSSDTGTGTGTGTGTDIDTDIIDIDNIPDTLTNAHIDFNDAVGVGSFKTAWFMNDFFFICCKIISNKGFIVFFL
jgi:hypothetical protein